MRKLHIAPHMIALAVGNCFVPRLLGLVAEIMGPFYHQRLGGGTGAGGLHTSCTGASLMVLRFHRTFDSGLCRFIHSASVGFAVCALAFGCLNP